METVEYLIHHFLNCFLPSPPWDSPLPWTWMLKNWYRSEQPDRLQEQENRQDADSSPLVSTVENLVTWSRIALLNLREVATDSPARALLPTARTTSLKSREMRNAPPPTGEGHPSTNWAQLLPCSGTLIKFDYILTHPSGQEATIPVLTS